MSVLLFKSSYVNSVSISVLVSVFVLETLDMKPV